MSKLRVRIETNGYNDRLDVTVRDVDDSVADEVVNRVLEILTAATAHQTLPPLQLKEKQ